MKRISFLMFFLLPSLCFAIDYLSIVERYIPSNPIIIEAGAHNGSDTVRMKRKWPEATIYAFEPRSDVFAQLKAKTRKDKNVHRYKLALSDHVGRQTFYLSGPNTAKNYGWKSDAQSSLLEPQKENWPRGWDERVKFHQKIVVNVTTLDHWALKNHIKKVDFLWLDLQGNEYQVLKASPQIFQNASVIKTEVSKVPLYKETLPYDQFKQWFEARGFVCVVECNKLHGDALFVKKELFYKIHRDKQ